MSTNYYYTPAPGHPLAAFHPFHIGKATVGWVFSFQGYQHAGTPEEVQAVEVGPGLHAQVLVPATPAFELLNSAEWKALLAQPGGAIFDEYDRPVELPAFLEVLELRRSLSRPPEHDTQVSRAEAIAARRDWTDAEGYRFTLSQFT